MRTHCKMCIGYMPGPLNRLHEWIDQLCPNCAAELSRQIITQPLDAHIVDIVVTAVTNRVAATKGDDL